MLISVVDTNVLVVADELHAGAPRDCISNASARLDAIRRSGIIAIDDGWRIIGEFQRNIDAERRPGVQPKAGSFFLQWLLVNRTSRRCHQCPITDDDERGFSEFPDDPRLAKFHFKDRKFVAVALAHRQRPPVVVASDRDWWDHREALADHVEVDFVCPELMTRLRSKG